MTTISTAAPTRPGTAATPALVPSALIAATLVTCGLPGMVRVNVYEQAPRTPRMNRLGMSQCSNMVSAMGYMSTMNTLALMPPMHSTMPITSSTEMAMTFFRVLLAPGLSRDDMIVSAMA